MKVGDKLYIVASGEEHVILEIAEDGYLSIQYLAMKNAGLQGGRNIIHKSEVDGVHIKHYPC